MPIILPTPTQTSCPCWQNNGVFRHATLEEILFFDGGNSLFTNSFDKTKFSRLTITVYDHIFFVCFLQRRSLKRIRRHGKQLSRSC